MLELGTLPSLQAEIRACVEADDAILAQLRADVKPLKHETRRIQPHSTAAISLVGTDGGHNVIQYDPFMVQVIRVVDSSNNEYCLEALTPRTPVATIDERHIGVDGLPRTPMGRMMRVLGVSSFRDLSFIDFGAEPKPSWIQVYRELTEWAVLLDLVRNRDFGTDTVVIQDGFLRSKVFRGNLFAHYRNTLESAITEQYSRNKRRIYVVGVSKKSKVLQTYQLAMSLESVMRTTYPAYVEVPRRLEENVYKWDEYARGNDTDTTSVEGNKFVAGKMFFVKFGSSVYDPIWAVDLLESQVQDASTVLGYVLNDALDGFPIPFYPQSLQRAHDLAALVDLDIDIIEDAVVDALRDVVGDKRAVVDESRLGVADLAGRRYR